MSEMSILDLFRKKQASGAGLFAQLIQAIAPMFHASDYLKSYKGWVYACVSAIAEDVSTIDLDLQEYVDGEWVKVKNEEENPIMKPLINVNDFMTSSYLLFGTQAYRELTGDAFWLLERNLNGNIKEIWPLIPTRVIVVTDETKFIKGYKYSTDKGNIDLPIENVIHFKSFNPNNMHRGMGTIEAAALAIDIDNYSAEWNKNFFFNAAIPSGIVKFPGNVPPDQLKLIKENWNATHRGVDRSNGTAFLTMGADFVKLATSQKDMEFLEQRRFSRDEILAMFKVPRTVLGITDDVNRANAEATEYVFAKRVIKPRMQFIVDNLNEFYIPRFDTGSKRYRFTFKDPVPQNRELVLKERETGLRMGYLTVNEVRKEDGLPPIDGGDTAYSNPGALPIGDVQPAKRLNAPMKKEVIKVDDSTNTYIKSLGTKLGIKSEEQTPEEKQKDSAEAFVQKRIQYIAQEIPKRRKEFQKLFAEFGDDIVKELHKQKSVQKSLLDDIFAVVVTLAKPFANKVKRSITDTLTDGVNYSGQRTIDQIGVDVAFDQEDPRVRAWLDENALTHATSIVDTMKDDLRAYISTAVGDGGTVQDVASKLGEFFDEQSKWRAMRIARTEVISGYAKGSLEGAVQSKAVDQKRWATVGDDKVSDMDMENEAEGWVALDHTFSSGDDAPASHPNCRCRLYYK